MTPKKKVPKDPDLAGVEKALGTGRQVGIVAGAPDQYPMLCVQGWGKLWTLRNRGVDERGRFICFDRWTPDKSFGGDEKQAFAVYALCVLCAFVVHCFLSATPMVARRASGV